MKPVALAFLAIITLAALACTGGQPTPAPTSKPTTAPTVEPAVIVATEVRATSEAPPPTGTKLDLQRKFITERLESARAKLDDYRVQEASGAEKRRLMKYVQRGRIPEVRPGCGRLDCRLIVPRVLRRHNSGKAHVAPSHALSDPGCDSYRNR